MKKILYLLLIICNSVLAQETAEKKDPEDHTNTWIGLEIGPSLALGSYNSLTEFPPLGSWAGSASLGYNYSFYANLGLSRNFGIGVQTGLFNNRVDSTFLPLVFCAYDQGSIYPNSTASELGYYTNKYFLLGPTVSFVQGKITGEASALFGGIATTFPYMRSTAQYDYSSRWGPGYEHRTLEYSAPVTYTYAASLGFRLKYALYWKLALNLHTQLIWATQRASITFSYTRGGYTAKEIYQLNMPVSVLNESLGLSFDF